MSCCQTYTENNPNNKSIETQTGSKFFQNFLKAAKSQHKNLFSWVIDGVSGIIKCIEGKTLYSDEGIENNRNICSQCEFATEKEGDGELTLGSQCMAKDSQGKICGCFLICKTQTGICPLGKFIPLNINISKGDLPSV